MSSYDYQPDDAPFRWADRLILVICACVIVAVITGVLQ